jgi:hypothetical protein
MAADSAMGSEQLPRRRMLTTPRRRVVIRAGWMRDLRLRIMAAF